MEYSLVEFLISYLFALVVILLFREEDSIGEIEMMNDLNSKLPTGLGPLGMYLTSIGSHQTSPFPPPEFSPKFEGYHRGDPCIYCGIPHDEVPIGDCVGKQANTQQSQFNTR